MADFLRRVLAAGSHAGSRDLAAAARTLAALEEETKTKRGELEILERELLVARKLKNLDGSPTLLEANQNLVLAALRAETIASTAVSNLGEISRLSQRDSLTGLPNRVTLFDRLENSIALARRHGSRIAIVFLDLDRFKATNDSFGHAVGDSVLQLTARRLESAVRDSDTVSRYGGDEFVILLTEILQAPDAAAVAGKIIASLSAPARVGEHVLRLSASLGIAIYPDDAQDATGLINRADAAMYACKKRKPGNFAFSREAQESAPQTPAEPAVLARRDPRLRDLREANERLMIAALTAQETGIHNAEEAHRRQIKFLAMVAHELRNPLTPIRTAAELLEHAGADRPMLARLQTIIKGQVVHLSRIVEDLLDGSRVSTGKFRLERTLIPLADTLNLAALTCQTAIDARNQRLIVQFPEKSRMVLGDPIRIVQIFTNLLDNASKYTQNGGEIKLAMVVLDHSIEITVSDNGIGITSEALPGIFGLFVQDEQSLSTNQRGLGIGLAVVRALVEAHGGTVAGSSEGKELGSQFVVSLPLPDFSR